MAAPDYSGVEQGIAKGYNAQRQQAASTEAGNLQGQKDALARRAAALGNAPGGAFVKAEQQTGNDSAQRLQQANAGIDAAQNAELRGVKMTQLGQQFTTSERQGSEAHADTAQAATFAHEDTSQGTGIQAAKEQQATGIASQEKMAAAQIEAQKTMQDKGITAQSTLQDRQLAAQEVMQKTGIDAQAAMQMVGITAQKDMQDTQQKFQADQAQKDRDIKVDEFMKQMDAQWAQINGYSIDPATGAPVKTHEAQVDAFNEDMANKIFNKKDILEKALGPFTPGGGSGPGGGVPGGLGNIFSGLGVNFA